MNYFISVQYEGTLGCLTTSSVHNPRRIIDIQIKPQQPSDEVKEIRKYKKLLMIIERVQL